MLSNKLNFYAIQKCAHKKFRGQQKHFASSYANFMRSILIRVKTISQKTYEKNYLVTPEI